MESSTQSKTLLYIILIVALAALGLAIYPFLNSSNIAFVESNVLIAEYSESKAAQEELNAKIEEWQGNITVLQQELEVMNNELLENAEGWSTTEREDHLGRMQLKQQELGRYSNAVNQQAVELEQQLMDPVYTTINNRIKAFGLEEGYSIVFGTVQGGNILYGDEAINVTWDFINYLEGDE